MSTCQIVPENIRWSLPDECQATCSIVTES